MKPRVPASKYKKFIEFVEFLKSENAIVFFRHIDSRTTFYRDYSDWVDLAFTWHHTDEGGEFWAKIENKWHDKLQREQNR